MGWLAGTPGRIWSVHKIATYLVSIQHRRPRGSIRGSICTLYAFVLVVPVSTYGNKRFWRVRKKKLCRGGQSVSKVNNLEKKLQHSSSDSLSALRRLLRFPNHAPSFLIVAIGLPFTDVSGVCLRARFLYCDDFHFFVRTYVLPVEIRKNK